MAKQESETKVNWAALLASIDEGIRQGPDPTVLRRLVDQVFPGSVCTVALSFLLYQATREQSVKIRLNLESPVSNKNTESCMPVIRSQDSACSEQTRA